MIYITNCLSNFVIPNETKCVKKSLGSDFAFKGFLATLGMTKRRALSVMTFFSR